MIRSSSLSSSSSLLHLSFSINLWTYTQTRPRNQFVEDTHGRAFFPASDLLNVRILIKD